MSLSTNLVAYYPLDNTSDSVGSNTLTNVNTVTFTTGKLGNCADFGSSNTNKKLTVANDLGITNGAMSMSIWVKLNAEISSNYYGIVQKGDAGTNVAYLIAYSYNGGTPQIEFNRQKQNISNNLVTYPLTMGTANWYNFILTYDGTTLKGYVNGSSVGTPLATSGDGAAGGDDVLDIGYTGEYSVNSYASIKADELAIWSRALTDDEVLQVSNSGRANAYPLTDTPSLYGGLAYYKLDESSGNASDSASFNTLTNTGTVPYAAAKINNGADFQGTNQILESASAIGFTAGGARTWNFWFKADVNGGYMLDNITNSGAQRRVTIYLNGTNLAVFTWNTDIDTGQAISTGTWYMATVCWNNGTITTYVNAVAKTGGTSGTAAGSANGFVLGADYGKTYGGARFNGLIDEVSVFGRVLTQTEINYLYNGGNGNQYPFVIPSNTSAFFQFM